MLEILSQIILCAILTGLLGLYIGYLLAKNSCEKIEKIEQTHN